MQVDALTKRILDIADENPMAQRLVTYLASDNPYTNYIM
jgi:hypothetical protein